jgi:hypothetical protein
MYNNIKILEFGYVLNDILNIIELHKEQDNYNNVIYIDIVDNLNVCMLIFNNHINGINMYVLGIKHNHILNLFTINDILELIKYCVKDNYIFVNNFYYKLINYISDFEILNKILDVNIYSHYINNIIDNSYNHLYDKLIFEKRFKEHLYDVKIDYSIINIYTIIQTSYQYYVNFIDLCFDGNFNKEDKINTYVVNFNFLNRLVINGIKYEDKIDKLYYSINSITKRPTIYNTFNYMNLSKKDNSREKITSKYTDGYLVEIDFQAYHLQLLDIYLKLFNNKDNNFNYHNEMSKVYFNKEIETIEDKNNVKKNTFYLLYNNNYIKDDSEIINKINKFKANVIEFYFKNNKIKSISGSYIYINEDDENKIINKIINYFMQDLETNTNLNIIKEIYLECNNKYDLLLYVYDSFLFDIKKEDLDIFIKYIENKFSKYIYSLKIGTNYNNLK